MTLPLNSELIARARKVAGECSVIETRTLLRALATALEQQSPVEPKDASDVVGRLRAEIEFQQGDAAAWGVDTYGDLPRNLAVMAEAAGLIASLQAQVEALTRERAEADDLLTSGILIREEKVERLRDFAEHLEPVAEYTDEQTTLREAVDRIETLERALKPFALIGEELTDANGWSDHENLSIEADPEYGCFADLKSGDFRRARSALSPSTNGADNDVQPHE